ncbi:protein of unknown function [Halovenus aranensis]|uniref:DUF4177 domain-containing protein n=1 Tax=Halovenus aranensis TaxID=890420 RepID=A0A1G8U963_9EURY|nr:DUF4177 domain-containing protein [Halovenus aranensis]SDJ50312.1 protein of unknown function [Halovenus aranensis]
MSDPHPTRWEYKTCRPERDEIKKEAEDPEALLNEYSSDGWEFVDTIDYVGGGTKYLVFRRPVTAGENP